MIPLSTGRPLGRFAGLKRAARAIGIDLRRDGDVHPLNLCFDWPLFDGILDDLVHSDRTHLSCRWYEQVLSPSSRRTLRGLCFDVRAPQVTVAQLSGIPIGLDSKS